MTEFIRLPYRLEAAAPPFETNAIKSPEALARHFIKLYSKRGGRVFDPFAGLGTTLFAAEELGRIPFGMEADPQRHGWVAGQLRHWLNLRQGDAARLDRAGFPQMDFCMTSPPYMRARDRWNPLYAGDPARAGYPAYLRRMGHIFAKVAPLLKRQATLVVQVDNIPGLKTESAFTPLVRDLGLAISKSFLQTGEVIVAYDKASGARKPDNPYTQCLIFKPR